MSVSLHVINSIFTNRIVFDDKHYAIHKAKVKTIKIMQYRGWKKYATCKGGVGFGPPFDNLAVYIYLVYALDLLISSITQIV